MNNQNPLSLPRRRFLATTSATAATMALIPGGVFAEASAKPPVDSLIGELYQSLTAVQKAVVARPWNDGLRQRVNANWHVTKPVIGDKFYDVKQRAMVEELVKQLTSESGHARLKAQTEEDDGGIEAYSMAWFGEPGSGKFEWMLTGRHLTLRADGNTQDKIAFGGPVVYGHGEESSPKENLFYYQTEKVQKVFEALSTDQRKAALLSSNPPSENSVQIQGQKGSFAGIAVGDLNQEQTALFRDALGTILSMYRHDDSAEALKIIEQDGGLESLRLAYFKKPDLLGDGVWDMWRIEGPSAVVHFRGAPHVHAYIHIKSI